MEEREKVDYAVMERLRARVEAIVNDPATAEGLKPYYRAMCKRPLSSDDFYPVFNQPNVTLIDVADTKGLEEITANGFVVDGKQIDVDCLIFASGFEVSGDLDRRWGIDSIEGRDGVSLYDEWRDGPKTLHGTMAHGFPNQFFIGYIQGGLNASVTLQFGNQGLHAAQIIADAMQKGLTSVEPSKEAQDAYLQHFADIEVDTSAFQMECTPSYFTNEGQVKAPWSLFRGYGHGWDAFDNLLQDWRAKGDLSGMITTA